MDITQNWMLMALLTPVLWAIGCLIDSCLIGLGIYRKATDGAIVACLFGVVPIVFVVLIEPDALPAILFEGEWSIPAFLAGIAFGVHVLFYFRTLFRMNDVSGVETFVSLSVLVVPFFAWWLLDEILPAHFYLAFAVAAAGVLLQCLPAVRAAGPRLAMNMLISVVAISLSMVLQSQALSSDGFPKSTVTFNLACLAFAAVMLAGSKRRRKRVTRLYLHLPLVLIGTELLGVIAILSSHRATQFAPSVSLVALMECLLPLIIMGFSFILILINRYKPMMSIDHQNTLAMQLHRAPAKLAAFFMLIVALISVGL